MLAKNMKIQTLMKQRQFITETMRKMYKKSGDGNAIYIYKGIIYPENLKYFSNEGFTIRTLDSERIIVEYGVPYYIFYPKVEIELNDSEMMMSEELANEPKVKKNIKEEQVYEQLLGKIFEKEDE